MAEKRVIELEIQDNVSEITEKTKSLRAQLREMKAQLANMDEESEEFKKLTREAGKLQDKIGDISTGVKNFASDTRRLDATLQGVSTITAGFGAVEGSMALVGVQSKELEETMIRLQAAMLVVNSVTEISNALQAESALMQTLNSAKTKIATAAQAAYSVVVGTSTGALRAFKIALATTGIGAIIVLLGMAASAMDLFGNSTEDAEAKQKQLEKQLEKTNLEIERSSNLYKDLADTTEKTTQRELINAKKRGASEEELNKIKRDGAKRRIELVQEEVDEATKRYLDLSKNGTTKQFEAAEKAWKEKHALLTDLKLQLEDEEATKIYDKRKEAIDKANDLRNAELEQIRENNRLALAENQARLRTEQEQAEFEVNEKYNAQIALAKKYKKDTTQLELAQANEINEIRLKYQQEEYAKAEEIRQKELAAIKEANRLKIEAEQELQAEIEAIDEANFQARLQKTMSEDEYALELVRQKYFALEEAAKGNAEQLAIIEEAKSLEIEAIDKKSKEKQISAENELRQKRLQLAGQAFTAIGDIIGAFTAKNDKDARKQFEIQKAFNLAAAVTNTAMAVTGALTAGGNPIKLATGTQFVEAGIAAAVGAANIIKIASSKFGGGASGGGGGAPAGGGGMVQSPNFSIIGSSGVNQLAQLQQQPTRAYVVSGEVTSQQALDRNRVQNATL